VVSRKRSASARRAGVSAGERFAIAAQAFQRALMPIGTLIAIAALGLLVERGVRALYAQPVTHISVAGKLETRHRDAVRQTVAERIDGGLLALDLQALREELEALPWIYRATLRREFPGTLHIRVIEQLPIARWGDRAFLNHRARVVAVADEERWDSLPLIRGPEGSQARLMDQYQRLLELLRPLELTVIRLAEDDFGQLSVELESGLVLQLGNREFAARVDDFLTLWRRELRDSNDQVLRVDMRYASGAAVAVREGPQLAGIDPKNGDR
jgi:cell division protein FtsQ